VLSIKGLGKYSVLRQRVGALHQFLQRRTTSLIFWQRTDDDDQQPLQWVPNSLIFLLLPLILFILCSFSSILATVVVGKKTWIPNFVI